MNLRIVLLPEVGLEEVAKQYSSLIADSYSTLFRLDDTHIPHITILHIEGEENLIEMVKDKMDMVSKTTEQISIAFDGLQRGDNYLGLYLQNDERVVQLRKSLLSAMQELKVEIHTPHIPHLTITRLEEDQDIELAAALLEDFPKKDFRVNQLALCEQGPSGTCKSVLAVYPLVYS